MSSRVERIAFWLFVAVLLALHAARIAAGHEGELWAGWLAPDMGWHMVWIAGGAVAVFWMTGRVWPNRE